jgi:cytochrome c peroxidase
VIAPHGKTAYVTLQARGELLEIDVATRAVTRTLNVGPWPSGIGCTSSADKLFVTRFISPQDAGEIRSVDVERFEVSSVLQLAPDPGPDTEAGSRGIPNYLRNVALSPDGAYAWLPSKKDNTLRGTARDGLALTFETSSRSIVSLIDLSTSQEALPLRVDLNNRGLGLSMTFSALGDYAFVALLANNGVEVLDTYTGKIVSGLFGLSKAPDGIVLDDAGHLYLNAFLQRTVVVLDATAVLASTDFALKPVTEVSVVASERLAPDVLAGKRIFYDAADERMGQDGYISCATCHLDGFEDGRVWDFTDRGEGLRNTSSLFGRRGTGQGRLHWSANFDEVQDFEHDIRNAFGGKGFLPDTEFNAGTRNTTLGDTKAGRSPELDAMAAYVTSLDKVSPSPFRDNDGSLTDAGWRGRELFMSAGCAECHSGQDFTDSASGVLHDVGTIKPTSGKRLNGSLTGIDTPTLRGVWQTAPYLHDGSAATLTDVLVTQNKTDLHGKTSALTPAELEDLLSYLLQIDNIALEAEAEPKAVPEPPKEPKPKDGADMNCGCEVPAHSRTRMPFIGLSLLLGLWIARRRRAL